MHLKTDLDDFHLTGGDASDSTQFEMSLDIGPSIRTRIAMTDKSQSSGGTRARHHTAYPARENSKQTARCFPTRLCKLRARIEQAIGNLKRFKRIATRCEERFTAGAKAPTQWKRKRPKAVAASAPMAVRED
jgi:hypothetical protein